MAKPRVFIGSSKASLKVAKRMATELEAEEFAVTVWQ